MEVRVKSIKIRGEMIYVCLSNGVKLGKFEKTRTVIPIGFCIINERIGIKTKMTIPIMVLFMRMEPNILKCERKSKLRLAIDLGTTGIGSVIGNIGSQ